jgi:hypothetical protein
MRSSGVLQPPTAMEPLFRKYIHVGRPMPNGEIASQNFVWLADWFIENYFYLYSRPVDLKFHHSLTRSIKALYPLLDNGWYASNGIVSRHVCSGVRP